MKSPAESEVFIKQRLLDLGIEFEITHEGVCEVYRALHHDSSS